MSLTNSLFEAAELRRRMRETGIGYAGVQGAWWLPATAPAVLPLTKHAELTEAAHAMFALLDVVGTHYGTALGDAGGLNYLLNYKVPPDLQAQHSRQPVLSLRPDFQLSDDGVWATELEICPSAQGYAHAMQLGYGLAPDLVPEVANLVKKRKKRAFVFICTHEWSEFLWEQLAFCRALAQYGVQGYVHLSIPIATLAEQVKTGKCWQPPIFGVPHKPAQWHDDILARLREESFEPYVLADLAELNPNETVCFRFGYFDCFSAALNQQMRDFEQNGAIFLNPASFVYENKAVMAALHLPMVQKGLEELKNNDLFSAISRCIPETRVLCAQPNEFTAASIAPEQLARERADWVLKFAGFDRGNQAWGGRSLQIGLRHSDATWREIVARYADLPFPVVAQRMSPSRQIDIHFYDANNQPQILCGGTSRLRAFMFRADADSPAAIAGVHLTVSGGTMQVSESSDAVQAPIVFA
ncbi:MAG: hypothetical protein KIH69_017895 [Anaerolineae bacterium]|nr:hypothetical protein [Anaerolineae bacterium]